MFRDWEVTLSHTLNLCNIISHLGSNDILDNGVDKYQLSTHMVK